MTSLHNAAVAPLPEATETDPGDCLPLSEDMAWFANLLGRLPRGANLLVGGDPGVGKSTLVQQIALSAALAGERVLIIATEQSRGTLLSRMTALSAPLGVPGDHAAVIEIIDDIGDLSLLPQLLARQVFARNGRLNGTDLIIIDSLHGLGNGPNDKRFYSAIFEYLRTASASGITTIALAHMNKARELSGPRALEHAIDASIVMRHGVSCRAMYVPKNRNGASRMEPFSVVIDEATTRIVPSPLSASGSARVRTIACDGPVTLEVALTLPRHERGFVKAPGLSPQEAAIIVDLMARIHPPAKTIGSLGVTVRAPGGVRFRREHALPIAVAIAAALSRVEVPEHFVVAGDVDLRGGVCQLGGSAMRLLDDAFKACLLGPRDVLVAMPPIDACGIESEGWKWQRVGTIDQALEVAALTAQSRRDEVG